MKIPLPCKLGQISECDGRMLPLIGATWFKWSSWGMEYTYFFRTPDFWHDTTFYSVFNAQQPYKFIIPDSLLEDKPIKEHGYPLKARGRANGISYIDGKIFMKFTLSSHYFSVVKVQCDDKGGYLPGGEIIFPFNWDTEEKRQRILYKEKKGRGKSEKTNELDAGQLSIFDFIKG